jgi:hypothetical protein
MYQRRGSAWLAAKLPPDGRHGRSGSPNVDLRWRTAGHLASPRQPAPPESRPDLVDRILQTSIYH